VLSLQSHFENTCFLLPFLWVILERYTQAKEIYQEALKQAELKKDEVSVQHIREELAELSRKSRPLT
jgi:hypothetical protein